MQVASKQLNELSNLEVVGRQEQLGHVEVERDSHESLNCDCVGVFVVDIIQTAHVHAEHSNSKESTTTVVSERQDCMPYT